LFSSSKKDTYQDDLQTIRDDAKVPPFISSKNRQSLVNLQHEKRLRSEEEDSDEIVEPKYEKTQRYTKTTKSPVHIVENQSECWYLPVNVKGGRFYSMTDDNTEYKIGETKTISVLNHNLNIEGGILVYSSISEALKNRFLSPRSSQSSQKIVLEVQVQGQNFQINKNAWLYSTVTPRRAIYETQAL